MKKQLFIIGMLLICGNLYAEKCAVQRSDGGITVIEYIVGSSDSLSDVLSEFGHAGKECVTIKSIPATREDRRFWKIDGDSITIDDAKKQDEIQKASIDSLKKSEVLAKLKITETELDYLRGSK